MNRGHRGANRGRTRHASQPKTGIFATLRGFLRVKGTGTPLALVALAGAMLVFSASAFAALPDNRAYELVSPVEKGGNSYMPNLAVAAASGEQVIVDGGPANSLLSSDASWMLETRTATGWSGVQVGPPPASGTEENGFEQRSTALAAVSEDFSSFAFQTYMGLDPRDQPSPPGVRSHFREHPAEDVPTSDVYVRPSPSEPFAWASGPPAPIVKTAELRQPECIAEPFFCATNNAVFAGGSSDLRTIVWSQLAPLVAAPASLAGSPADTHQHGSEVYASTDGVDQRLVGLVPASGSECGVGLGSCVVPSCGAAMGNAIGIRSAPVFNSFAPTEGAVSGDGSQVVFTSPEPAVEREPGCHPGEIYVREGDTTTVQVSASQRTGGDPHGPRPKLYADATQEAGEIDTVFFTSSEELTNNANTGSEDQGSDLYAYSMATGKLTDITPDSNPADANGASVIAFIDASTDGSIVYFTATGVLSPEPNSQGETAQGGVSNLYVYDANTDTTRFVAPGNRIEGVRSAKEALFPKDALTSQATPDGQHLVFLSSEHITSYDNAGSAEVYLYDEASNRVVCVSCNPSSAPPSSSASLGEQMEAGGHFSAVADPYTLPPTRFVSDNGERVFFDSPDQLTPDAPPPTPGKLNVYEYENGHLYLIAPAAALATITPSGNDVFFYTADQLVAQDRDGTADTYDARVDGGFPTLAPPACSGTSCQGAPAPAPIFETPAGVTFHGASGNVPASPPPPPVKTVTKKTVKCKAGFVEKKVKSKEQCVKKPRKKAKAKKSAHTNRRAGR
jgi:hypothetical protein